MKELIIKNDFGEKIDFSFSEGDSTLSKNNMLIVMGHGVTGNKDRPVLTETEKFLNAVGYDTLRFSFSGNGESEGNFRDSTISKEVGDLDAVLNSVYEKGLKIVYLGHSMGGAVGVLKASTDERINALISLAGMVDTKAFAEAEFGDEIPDQGLMWEEKNCPLSSIFMEDLCGKIVSVLPQAKQVSVPWILFHGTQDDVVLPADTDSIKELNLPNTTIHKIEGASHSFEEAGKIEELSNLLTHWLDLTSN